MAWRVTIRIGSKVTKHRAGTASDAIALLERELAVPDSRRKETRALSRTYAPQQQVAARGEVRGGGSVLARRHGGVDVRGDGSMEAYTGRVSRRLVEPDAGESPFAALLQALS